ncbi:hypothetical protein P7C73_g4703, partial [Tremellales sp. Uapishka_1]
MSSTKRPSPVTPAALSLPIFKKLADKRVVLASSSPRRKDILETMGFRPEIIPSTFAENLPHASYAGNLADYPIATAGEKALEVYERLMVLDDRDPADLVISADTVVVFPPESETREGGASHGEHSEILEKPLSKAEQMRSLLAMSGRKCEVITGITIIYPIPEAPGYRLQSISTATVVQFYDNDRETIQAYVDSGEGLDRAGGFAIQIIPPSITLSISADSLRRFPSAPFWRWMSDLHADGTFDEM